MKNFIFTFVGILLTLSTAQAETYFGPTNISNLNTNNIVINGPANLKKINTSHLTITGPLEFADLEVKEQMTIYGPLINGQNLKCKKFNIIGPMKSKNINCDKFSAIGTIELQRLTVKQDMDIIGSLYITDFNIGRNIKIIGLLEATNGTIKDLEVTSSDITLQDVNINNIIINVNKGKQQTLYLKGKSLVKGNINFISGKGLIVKGSDVQIKGEITGAIIKSE